MSAVSYHKPIIRNGRIEYVCCHRDEYLRSQVAVAKAEALRALSTYRRLRRVLRATKAPDTPAGGE